MSTKDKAGSTPAEKGNGDASAETSTAVATTDDASQMPAEVDPYMIALAEAKDGLVTSLTKLHDGLKADSDEQKQIARLLKTVNPVKRGREEVSTRWTIPVIRLVQNMTREKPDNCKPGDFYTSSGSKVEQPFRFAPLYMFEMNRMFPSDGMKGPVCVSPDAKLGTMFGLCNKCANLPFTKNTSGNFTDCDSGLCFLVLGSNMRLYRLEFFKTSKKTGTKIIQLTDEADDIWDRMLSLNSEQIRGDKGNFFVFRVSASGEEEPDHIREAAVALYDMINIERKAYLKRHWENVLKGGQKATTVDENVNLDELGVGGDSSDNPDLSGAGL
jgi:hypothetical protein